jgi:hypothetical protein
MRVRAYEANRQGDLPGHVLYKFHLAEKRRESRRQTVRMFAAWIVCGLIIGGLCCYALLNYKATQ